MAPSNLGNIAFAGSDYAVGAVTGVATAMAVRAFVGPSWDMVLAMLAGMGIGMAAHLVVGLLASPLVGFFHFMVPGSLIGMYGGMMFAMRDVMQHGSSDVGGTLVGGFFGVVVVGVVRMYDRVLRAPAAEER